MNIFVIIDAQNDFIDGPLGTAQAQITTTKICKTLYKAIPEEENTLVYMTRDTHYGDYEDTLEGKNLPTPHCIIHSEGWNINSEILDAAEPFYMKIIDKGSFGSYPLVGSLVKLEEKHKIDSITIMGFCTDICVITNALMIKSMLTEIPIKVKADCCAGTTIEKHKAALEVMKSCQIEII